MNDWRTTLIRIYLRICEVYEQGLGETTRRMSNNDRLDFSDEELLTVYLFGLLQEYQQLNQIHRYCRQHLSDWFPKLPGYVSFVDRLNRLSPALLELAQRLESELPGLRQRSIVSRLVDSTPIILATGRRSDDAKVAPELASKGYCSSKDLWYYGVKL